MKYVQWQGFLPPELMAMAQKCASDRRALFKPATILPPRDNFRSARVLLPSDYLLLHSRVIGRLMQSLSIAVRDLDMDMTECKVDLQMTRHGNGDYFKRHVDIGKGDAAARKISFIIYFHLTEQPMFSGGELKLYSSSWRLLSAFGKTIRIAPSHNTLVLFPSHLTHEVTPVVCSEQWEHGRFSLNGWLS